MSDFLKNYFRHLLLVLKQNAAHFPAASSCLYAWTIGSICYLEFNSEFSDTWVEKALLIFPLGFLLYLGEKIATKNLSRDLKSLSQGLVTVFLLVYFQWGLPLDLSTSYLGWIIQFSFFMIIGILFLTWAPFLFKKSDNKKIWSYNYELWSQILTCFILSVLLVIFLNLGILSLEALFSLDFDSDIYLKVLILVSGIFSTNYVLLHTPKEVKSTEIKISKTPEFFFRYILLPIVASYFAILYIYIVKVIITQDVPQNILSSLTIVSIIAGILTYFVWTPFWSKKSEKYKPAFWVLLMPLILMLFWALYLRVSEYGFTESRSVGLIFAFWIMSIVFYFLWFRNAQLKSILKTLTLIIFIFQFGPWSIYEISYQSQKERLEYLLEKNDITFPIKKEKNIDAQDLENIRSIIHYIKSDHGERQLRRILNNHVSPQKSEYYSVHNVFKEMILLKPILTKAAKKDLSFWVDADRSKPLDILGYDFFSEVNWSSDKEETSGWKITFEKNQDRILMKKDGTIFESIYIKDEIKKIESLLSTVIFDKSSFGSFSKKLSPKKLSFPYESKNLKARIFINNLSVKKGKIENINFRGIAFSIKEKDKSPQAQ